VTARTVSVPMAVVGGPQGMTIEACETACQAAGYVLSGVEYYAECYCDNTLKNGVALAPDGNAMCNMACNGNAAENCCGELRWTEQIEPL
jgi:glucan 1,3-beta-glucosidase